MCNELYWNVLEIRKIFQFFCCVFWLKMMKNWKLIHATKKSEIKFSSENWLKIKSPKKIFFLKFLTYLEKYFFGFPMETTVWLWLYDKRWLFGIKPPSVLNIWYTTFLLILLIHSHRSVPLLNNVFFFVTLYYYFTAYHHDASTCYDNFKDWIFMRIGMLIMIVVGIIQVYRQTSKTKAIVR